MNDVIDTKNMFDFVARLNSNPESKVLNVWKNVVSKIKTQHDNLDDEKRIPIGERLASNTRVINLKNGVLLVETDHSGWIQYLKIYQKFILNGLKMALPDLKINTLAFRISGSNVNLSETYEEALLKAKDNYLKKIDDDEKKIKLQINQKNKENVDNSSKLPPELNKIFEDMKQSMKE